MVNELPKSYFTEEQRTENLLLQGVTTEARETIKNALDQGLDRQLAARALLSIALGVGGDKFEEDFGFKASSEES